ncbi:MAG: tetratricopeptide repeat protein [Treponema sp.]|jgi:tetratricopeptide (TPR) repeat protein|nr:tetratricopeptide repeat protein [Treponema sp.]
MNELIIGILIMGNTFLLFFAVKYLVAPSRIETLAKLLKEGNTRGVIKSARAIIAKQPKNAEAHYYLGMAYLAENRTSAALIELKLVSQLGIMGRAIPEIEFRQTMAQLFIRGHQPEEAIKEYLLLIKLAPEKAEFYYQAGKLFVERNRIDMAKQYFYKAGELNPYDGRVHCELGSLLYKEQRPQEAKIELEKAIQFSRRNGQAYFYLGKLFKDAQDYAAALQSFEQALQCKAYKINALIERGICYMALDAMDKAVLELELAIKTIGDETHPDSLYARYFMGVCYERFNHIDKALAQWDRVYAIKKHFYDVENKLAQYADYRYDVLKDYLNYGDEQFLALCKDMVTKGMGFKVQEMKVIPNGSELVAIEGHSLMDENNRDLYCLMRFYRIAELVHEPVIYTMLEDLKRHNIHRGIIVTNSGFAQDAIDYAEARSVELFDKEKLLKLLQKTIP